MKTLIIILTMLCSLNTNGNENIHYDTAMVTSCNYYAEENTTIACFTDSNGTNWIEYGIEAPVGSKCIIEYDTKGNDDIYDDEITNIIYLSDVVEVVGTSELDYEKLENRNGKLIIEQVVGVVDDAETGDGHVLDAENHYICYSRVDGISKGDVVCTYLVYNPYTSYTDDITARFDFIIQ